MLGHCHDGDAKLRQALFKVFQKSMLNQAPIVMDEATNALRSRAVTIDNPIIQLFIPLVSSGKCN